MKESRLYLRFFVENLLLIVSPAVVLGFLVGWWSWHQPQVIHHTQLLSMDYTAQNVQSQIQLTDQAVSLLRERGIQEQLGIKDVSTVVYKSGPLLMSIDTSGQNESKLDPSIEVLSSYAQNHFPLHREGIITRTVENKNNLGLPFLGVVIGFGLGFLASLLKTYWKNY